MMAAPYSMDLRLRCMEALRRGEKESVVAQCGGVATKTLRNWKRREREQGHVKPVTEYRHGPRPKVSEETLKAHVESCPDMFMEERGRELGCSASSISRRLKALGYTRKKRPFSTGKGKKSSGLSLMKN